MVLSYKSLKKYFKKNLLIENANNQNIQPASYDLTLDKYVIEFKKSKKPISLIDAQELDSIYEEVNITEGYEFRPGTSILAVIEDTFNMPNDVCGTIRGRASLNRLGLAISFQHLNPGFKGKLNITITNNSTNSYLLTPKIQIAQAVFEKLDKKVKKKYLYSNIKKKASYQNDNGRQGSKIYYDYIGKVVRHYKGNYYYVEDICMNSETKEYTVIYRSLYDNELSNVWARPAEMFIEEIDPNDKGNVTKQNHRFEIVNDLTIDRTKKDNKKD